MTDTDTGTDTDTDTDTGERNGVPTEKFFATIARMRDNGDLAAFRFSAKNEWIEGHREPIDDPRVVRSVLRAGPRRRVQLCGRSPDARPRTRPDTTGVRAAGSAACITAGIATGAAAREIELTSISSQVTGDIDVRGVLGIDADIRTGFSDVRIAFDVQGDADRETLDALVASATKYSAVFDVLTNPTAVTVSS